MKATLHELYGLFVDDTALAAAIVGWLAGMAALLRLIPAARSWAGVLLAAGLVLLLVESAMRFARRRAGR